jgi:hypothetical protein
LCALIDMMRTARGSARAKSSLKNPLPRTERIDVARGGASASTGRIDGCVALAMALQMITMAPKRESVYHSRGRISLSG